jgi:phage baseplate assembly protein W
MATQLTRAQTLTGTQKKTEFFSDFVTSFATTPVGNQLGRVTNEKSVNQALRNLILTNQGERLFQPEIGADVNYMLFENNMPENYDLLETFIKTTIKNFEPRAEIQKVIFATDIGGVSTPLGDSRSFRVDKNVNHELYVTIVYNLINNPEIITFNLLLKRVR